MSGSTIPWNFIPGYCTPAARFGPVTPAAHCAPGHQARELIPHQEAGTHAGRLWPRNSLR